MLEINEDIIALEIAFKNSKLKTPPRIDSDVDAFCKYVDCTEKPRYLNINPFHWCRVNCCDLNVKKAMKDYGGKAVYGFRLWSLPTMYIEADLHCVWENLDGNLVDITPSIDFETKVLFLPDPKIKTVRFQIRGDKPRLPLRESLYEYVYILTERENEIANAYPSDEEMWNNSISFKRLKKKKRK
jgi:hypothetical protein